LSKDVKFIAAKFSDDVGESYRESVVKSLEDFADKGEKFTNDDISKLVYSVASKIKNYCEELVIHLLTESGKE